MTLSAPGCADITITVQQSAAGVIFSVSETEFNVDSPNGTENVVITSNLDWIVKVSEPWIMVNPMMGSGTDDIRIDYTENPSLDTRIGMVTICATGQPELVITVTQTGVTPTLTIDKDRFVVDQSAGSESVVITSNTEWSIKSPANWITLDPESGTGDATVTITFTDNPDLTERTAVITVCSPDLPDQSIEVIQSGRAGNLSVDRPLIEVDAPASIETFEIMADVDWTIEANVNWLSFSPDNGSGDGTITLDINTNIDANERTGVITVSSPGLSDRQVTVIQAGAVASRLTVTPTQFDLPANPGGSRTIDVTSNIDWEFELVGGGWISIDNPTNTGSNDGVINFTFDENTGSTTRFATITVSGVGVQDLSLIHI